MIRQISIERKNLVRLKKHVMFKGKTEEGDMAARRCTLQWPWEFENMTFELGLLTILQTKHASVSMNGALMMSLRHGRLYTSSFNTSFPFFVSFACSCWFFSSHGRNTYLLPKAAQSPLAQEEIVSISIIGVLVICFVLADLSLATKMKWDTQTKLIINTGAFHA